MERSLAHDQVVFGPKNNYSFHNLSILAQAKKATLILFASIRIWGEHPICKEWPIGYPFLACGASPIVDARKTWITYRAR